MLLPPFSRYRCLVSIKPDFSKSLIALLTVAGDGSMSSNPKYQNVKAKNLSVEFTINFSKQKGLFKAFYNKYKNNSNWKFKYSEYIGILKF